MITTALLFRMAKACAGPDEPHLTLVTADDGTRYAAWPYGVVRLPLGVLRGVADGIYRLYANGDTKPYRGSPFSPEGVRSQVLPLLDQDRTIAVYGSPWMCQVGHGVQRILDRSEGPKVVVSQALWECWEQASPLPIWQLGGLARPLVWAEREGRAEALLMPIWNGINVQAPDVYRDAIAAASGADLPLIRIYPVQRKNRRFWRATFPAHPGLDLRGHIECNSLPALHTALDAFAETHGYAVTVQEPPDA